jgi:hypothetical protein
MKHSQGLVASYEARIDGLMLDISKQKKYFEERVQHI